MFRVRGVLRAKMQKIGPYYEAAAMGVMKALIALTASPSCERSSSVALFLVRSSSSTLTTLSAHMQPSLRSASTYQEVDILTRNLDLLLHLSLFLGLCLLACSVCLLALTASNL